jgi:hypothetical protein
LNCKLKSKLRISSLIFLNRFNGEKGSNWIVNRTLHAHHASKWTLNGKQTTEAAVNIIFKD